jgi:hypothetical protein
VTLVGQRRESARSSTSFPGAFEPSFVLNALVVGERSPMPLARMARTSLRGKVPALQEAFTGRFTGHHAFSTRTSPNWTSGSRR